MKRALFLAAFFLIISTVQARSAVFISQYETTIEDTNTYAYYQEIYDTFSSVEVVKDSEVTNNSTKWRNAYENADLIFLISLGDGVLTTPDRNLFCGNLSAVKTKIKGIVFAGNSLINDGTTKKGCPYHSSFDLATDSKNVNLKNDTVKIVLGDHPITSGYTTGGEYNISIQDTVYTMDPKGEFQNVGTVHGTPDGVEGDYPFLTYWEGVGYRAVIWGINTSTLTGCENCLGWTLFDQLLDWTSDTDKIGFKIEIDKVKYAPGERVNVNVTSPADITSLYGEVIYPDNSSHSLVFVKKSGKEWNTFHDLENDAPNGGYLIRVTADETEKTINFTVKAFDLTLDIDSTTKDVEISVDVMRDSTIVNDVNVTVRVTSPSNQTSTYSYVNNGSFSLIHAVSESGSHSVFAEAIDQYNRTDSETEAFTFIFERNVTFLPSSISKIVSAPTELSFSVEVTNENEITLSDIQLSKGGEIANWIELENETLPDLNPDESEIMKFNVNVPDVEEGDYTGKIILTGNGDEYELPITVKMSKVGVLSVTPQNLTKWMPEHGSDTAELELKNEGDDVAIIESMEITGDVSEFMNVFDLPTEIGVGKTFSLTIQIVTSDVGNLKEEFTGKLEITTQDEIKEVSLRLTVVKDLVKESDFLSIGIYEAEMNITALSDKIDVSDLETELEDLQSKLKDVKTHYSQGNYEQAMTSFEAAESDLRSLNLKIERKWKGIGEKRKSLLKKIAIVFFISIAVIVGFLAYRKFFKERQYKWLYKKWGKEVTS